MQKTSLTEAGQADSAQSDTADLIDAINQVFGLFRINFHNQYYKAFPDADTLNPVKKLWLEGLKNFNAQTILAAAKSIIEGSDFLPTLHKMVSLCESIEGKAAPDVHSAYLEACRAPNPKAQYAWSHPAVYHAGKASDWYFLSSANESTAFPVFRNHYNRLVDEMRNGVHFSIPKHLASDKEKTEPKLDKSSAMAKISAIRNVLNDT